MPTRLHKCVITSYDVINDEGELVHYAFYVDIEPINADETLKDSRWIKAMVDEIKSIEDNDTWSLIEFPKGKKAFDVKWVYKVKLNPKGEATRHKERLVIKGFLQKEGINYDEVFALLDRIKIIKLVIGLADTHNWSISQMDVKCTFLNDSLDEEVYVTQPVRFVKHYQEGKVYRLQKPYMD